jgi:steroid 5-alpha reductase family enzyme
LNGTVNRLYNGFPVVEQIARSRSLAGAFALCGIAYVLALGVAIAVGSAFAGLHPMLVVLVSDVAATLAVYAFSRSFRNASFYDPYWSLAPIAIAVYYMLGATGAGADGIRRTAVLVLVAVWGSRLAYNWARQWRGMPHEDWRYVNLRSSSRKWFWLVDLIGIEMMPTLIVFAGCMSLYPALRAGQNAVGVLDALAFIVTGGAIAVEAIADEQLRRFAARHRGSREIMSTGLWAHSRHPNYFGEVTFWWGLYLFALASDPGYWWTVAGPLAITILFVSVSIPLMDRRSIARRPGYVDHMERVSALVPWYVKK